MKKLFIIGIGITIFLSLNSCWKRQDNQIAVPETPVYTFSGAVISSSNNQAVENVSISLVGVVKYNDVDSSKQIEFSTTSDAQGNFNFNNVPGGYGYTLTAAKDGFKPLTANYVVYYENREIGTVMLGKLLARTQEMIFPLSLLSGITVANNEIWLADSSRNCLMELDNNLQVKAYRNALELKPVGLTFDGNAFWTMDAFTDSLCLLYMSPDSLIIAERFGLPVDPNDLNRLLTIGAMSWYQTNIWMTSPRLRLYYIVFKPGEPISLIGNTPIDGYRIVALTHIDDTLYFVAYYENDYRLYKWNLTDERYTGYYCLPNMSHGIVGWQNGIASIHNSLLQIYSF
jgi:hypothetical protein